MGEHLSQAELDVLLAKLESSPQPKTFLNRAPQSPEAWSDFDVLRSERLPTKTLVKLQQLQLKWSQSAGTRLEGLLRSRITVRSREVYQGTIAELVSSTTANYAVCLLSNEPTNQTALILWSARLMNGTFAQLLGGDCEDRLGDSSPTLTSIERRLFAKLNESVRDDLSRLLDVELAIDGLWGHVGTDLSKTITGPGVWLELEIEFGSCTGSMYLGIPRRLLEKITGVQLDENEMHSIGEPKSQSPASISSGLRKVAVDVSASLARLKLRASDLGAIQIGDVLMTDVAPSEAITLRVGEQTVCHGQVGVHRGRRAVKLTEPPTAQ